MDELFLKVLNVVSHAQSLKGFLFQGYISDAVENGFLSRKGLS